MTMNRRGSMKGWIWVWLALSAMARGGEPKPAAASATTDGRSTNVVVLYNTAVPDSVALAQYYAAKRGVATNRLVGLSLPTAELISRADYEARLQRPLVSELIARGLMSVKDEIQPATTERPGRVVQVTTGAAFRYLTLCYGVPLRVTEDPTRREPETAGMAEGLRRNEAAVDAELSVLPWLLAGQPLTGPLNNPLYGHTNALLIRPANGFVVVGRLDGPSAPLAAALVDRALDAEQNGLLGRAYFDIRSIADPAFLPGDLRISNACVVAKGYGFDTVMDRRAETLPTGFPLSHVAIYAGWYAPHATGPFTLPQVEFMPGAIAYHLHSFNAVSLRSTNTYWLGPLVAKGVTATMGTVAEPYLDGTPDIGLALVRLMYSGFTWGEAAFVSQRLLSWQLTVVGDPLYRPFGLNALERAKDLAARKQGRLDWSLVLLYNRRHEVGGDLDGILKDLGGEPRLKFSSILQEKLADFTREAGRHERAAELYTSARKGPASPQQKKRLAWNAGEEFQAAGRERDAYEAYESLVKDPNPADDPISLYERLSSLAEKLDERRDLRKWNEALEKLRTPPAK